MIDSSGSVRRGDRCRRRTVLRSLAVAAGVTGTTGVVGAQDSGGPTRGVIPAQPQYQNAVTGFFLHVAGEVDPTEAGVDDCGVAARPDEETVAYDARLIDRKTDPQVSRIPLSVHGAVAVEPGTLFVISAREQCGSGSLGVELERTGVTQLRSREFTPGGTEGGSVGASGPGPGVVSALAGLVGAGWLVGRGRE